MLSEERAELMKKRSSLRSWRERGGRMQRRGELIGATLLAIVFLALAAPSFWSGGQNNSTSSSEQQKPAIVSEKASLLSGSIPAPGIVLYSPENTTYNTSMPPLNFVVSGRNISSVLLSVDGGPNITIPHNGTTSKIDSARLNPLFIEDFSRTKKGQWIEKGSWRMEGGKYITKDGISSFGSSKWDDYIVETKTKITSGKNISIDLRWDGKSNYYSMQTNAYGNLQLSKVDTKGNTNLSNTKLPGIDPANWHTWKVVANGSKIQGFIDDVKYIEYTDDDNPYLKGSSRLRVQNATVEYDYVNVYKPLSSGSHKITIFANNTAGNASSRVVYFTIRTAQVNRNEVGKIGVPLVKNGFEITVKSATAADFQTSIWIQAKNTGDTERSFKLNPNPVIIDNNGNQYEKIKVARSAEIAQTDLYPQAKREGAIFFERFKEGAKPKRLVLYVNGDRFEFMLDESNHSEVVK